MADLSISVLALCTGFLAGALFKFINVPIPAPPELPGVLGIVGIYLGYQVVTELGVGFDLLGVLGL